MRGFVLSVAFLGLLASVLLAQPPADPSFEVASVKSNRTEAPGTTLFPLGPGDAYAANGGRFRATNQPLITYLRFAFTGAVGAFEANRRNNDGPPRSLAQLTAVPLAGFE